MNIADYGGSTTPPEHRDSWRTPPELFAGINAEFRFSGDVAASAANALHQRYLTEQQDALQVNWLQHFGSGILWCNPPYSNITPWVEKANHECDKGIGTVMLVPADTSVGWFNMARQACTEVRFITGGRLSFIRADTGKPVNGNNKGSMLIIWNPYRPATGHTGYVDRDTLMQNGRIFLQQEQPQKIPEIIPETENEVWPAEVNLLSSQLSNLQSLESHHQRKVMHHINRMLLERQPSGAIIAAAQSLTATFGEHTQ